ncbi:hypothetical protein F4779DRAFT_618258 [Xylariaceae sp. FL0662B]|nr:hypothetical protein F4779DRAFT_618258 [Xylariaceae sp. FL0662B]
MSSSVPSAASVLNKLNQQISGLRTVPACLHAVSLLSESERKALVESAAKYHLTPADKLAFTTAAVQALSSDDLDEELREAADGAYEAVEGIVFLIVGLEINLSGMDNMNGKHVTEEYEPVQILYYETMRDGIPLANTIAQYAEGMSHECERVSQPDRDAEGYQKTAEGMQNSLESVLDKTTDFINRVSGKSLGEEATAKTFPVPRSARKLADVSSLDLKIPALKLALASPFGPYVTVAGLFGIANTEATNAAYAIAASMAIKERVPLRTVMNGLAMQAQSESADDDNTEYFDEFRDNIRVIAGYWVSTIADAREIEAWLKDGASLVEMPAYMEQAFHGGAKIYVKVAKYLRSYADQNNQLPWDEWLHANDDS